MFLLEGKNKLGLISSFIYFVAIFVDELIYFIGSISGVYFNYRFIAIIADVIGAFIVFALVKDFLKDRSAITVAIGAFLFLYLLLNFMYGSLSIWKDICVMGVILFMSIRLVKSPNIGKVVGIIGFLYIIFLILEDFRVSVNLYEYFNYIISSLWWAAFHMIPSGIFFSYFLFYEKD